MNLKNSKCFDIEEYSQLEPFVFNSKPSNQLKNFRHIKHGLSVNICNYYHFLIVTRNCYIFFFYLKV
ncbi:hypothetical protein PUN28_010793 [Cardiocondyla obscurior]|uniref:Uncharacterized protein n=1 Tax=Cardiocondyla obscurior TaxID=286306 RepID=A0AAW2FNN4_9HYME